MSETKPALVFHLLLLLKVFFNLPIHLPEQVEKNATPRKTPRSFRRKGRYRSGSQQTITSIDPPGLTMEST